MRIEAALRMEIIKAIIEFAEMRDTFSINSLISKLVEDERWPYYVSPPTVKKHVLDICERICDIIDYKKVKDQDEDLFVPIKAFESFREDVEKNDRITINTQPGMFTSVKITTKYK